MIRRLLRLSVVLIASLPWAASAQLDAVFTDDFTGARLDQSRWEVFLQNGASVATGSGLRFTLNGTGSFSQAQVFTWYQLTGDFDVQVDFALGPGWNNPFLASDSSPQLNGGAIVVYLDDPNWMSIARSRLGPAEVFNFYSNVDLGAAMPRGQTVSSTATRGSLRVVSSDGMYRFSYNTGAGWAQLATAPAWRSPVRIALRAGNVNAHVSYSSTLGNFRINSGATDYVPYNVPGAFSRRSNFIVGGQFVQATIVRWKEGVSDYRPMDQLAAQGMGLARGCMTTTSDPDLESTPPAQWSRFVWKDAYWSSLQMMTQLYQDAMAAGMAVNACFFLSDGAADGSRQHAPAAWRNLSVADTVTVVEQYTYDATLYLRNHGIRVDLYDMGNEIMMGILDFTPGGRIPFPAGLSVDKSMSYMQAWIWPTEATLLTAAIRGVRRADPSALVALHAETSSAPGMAMASAFFETMKTLGVPFDIAALSLPYMDGSDFSGLTMRDYFQRMNDLVDRIAALGKPVYIAETAYPAVPNPAFNPPMPDFPYSNEGQRAYVRSQLIWASNNRNIVGWTWFYPEWFPGINPTEPANLVAQGLFSDRTTLRPAAAEFNVMLPGFAAPGPPSSLSASVAGSTVTLRWSTPGSGSAASSHIIEAGSSADLNNLANFSTGSTATVYSTSGVPIGTYYVRVKSANAAGTSGPSNEVVVVIR